MDILTFDLVFQNIMQTRMLGVVLWNILFLWSQVASSSPSLPLVVQQDYQATKGEDRLDQALGCWPPDLFSSCCPADDQGQRSCCSGLWTIVSSLVNNRSSCHICSAFSVQLLMYCLDAAARPWKSISWNSLCTVLELIWRSREVWRSVAIASA